MLRDIGTQLLGVDLIVVLGRKHDVVHAAGFAVVAIPDRDLYLAVRPQVAEGLVAPNLGQLASEPVRQRDRQGHELGRVVAGEAEHHPRVTRAADVNALCDVG